MDKRGYKKKASKATSKGSLRNSAWKKAIAVSANLAARRESDTPISENFKTKNDTAQVNDEAPFPTEHNGNSHPLT